MANQRDPLLIVFCCLLSRSLAYFVAIMPPHAYGESIQWASLTNLYINNAIKAGASELELSESPHVSPPHPLPDALLSHAPRPP